MIQKNIIVENLNINYYQSDNFNQGKALVFLHGWRSEALAFKSLFNNLENFIAVDFPGFGRSDLPKSAWNISDYADFVQKFLEKLEIKNPILVGHSFGGRVIIKYNTSCDNVRKNILIDSAGLRSNSKKLTLYKIGAKIFKAIFSVPGLSIFKESARKKFYKSIRSEDYINAGQLQEIYQKTISEDLSEDMKKINKETVLIWGENDEETPLLDGEKMNDLISGSRLYVIKGAGHYPFLNSLEEFNEIFLKEIHVD